MIKEILSRYNSRYPRALVYMLQATEYKPVDYFKWYRALDDFSQVEKRKKFVGTKKAYSLLICVWVMLISLYFASFYLLLSITGFIKYFYFIITILIWPYMIGYLIVIPLFALHCLQWFVEYFIILDAKARVKRHPAIKIGISGSYGKTTMREILKVVLSEGKSVSAPPHSYNTLLGISKFIRSLKGNEEVLIFELGEYYPGDIRDLCAVAQPELGIITGVNEAHLEKFKDLSSTTKTIFELADYLQEKPVYINGENILTLKNSSKEQIPYSAHGCGQWRVKNPHTDLTGVSFTLVKDNTEFNVKSRLLGLHHIGPLVAAADVALRLGLTCEQIEKGINNTKPFAHRLEPRLLSEGVVMLDDSYNGNPDGVRAVVSFLASLKGYRRFYVTPGLVEMGIRTEEVHDEIGVMLAESGIEKVVLVRNSVTPYIESGLRKSNYKGDLTYFSTGPEAFAALTHLTVPGDVVLIQNDWPDQYR